MARQASKLDSKKVVRKNYSLHPTKHNNWVTILWCFVFQNSELFSLTYGSLVAHLVNDLENTEGVNKQLERMGYNIGVRLIEDFLAKTSSGRCYDFKDTAEKIQLAFRNYLGVTPTVSNWNSQYDEFSLVFTVIPLTEFVELPDNCLDIKYCNILPGIIRGACEMVGTFR